MISARVFRENRSGKRILRNQYRKSVLENRAVILQIVADEIILVSGRQNRWNWFPQIDVFSKKCRTISCRTDKKPIDCGQNKKNGKNIIKRFAIRKKWGIIAVTWKRKNG